MQVYCAQFKSSLNKHEMGSYWTRSLNKLFIILWLIVESKAILFLNWYLIKRNVMLVGAFWRFSVIPTVF